MKESPPVCGEHVQTGRLDTQINNSHYKKSNVMSILNVYLEKLKIEKEKASTKVKIYKHKYTVTNRYSEKIW